MMFHYYNNNICVLLLKYDLICLLYLTYMKKGNIISNYWDLIEYNVHHIRHSELKASLILTAYGIIFGLAYDVSGDLPIPEKYKYVLYTLILSLIHI